MDLNKIVSEIKKDSDLAKQVRDGLISIFLLCVAIFIIDVEFETGVVALFGSGIMYANSLSHYIVGRLKK